MQQDNVPVSFEIAKVRILRKVDTSTLPSKSDIRRKKKPKVRSREDLATTSQNALRKITIGTFQRASTIQIHD